MAYRVEFTVEADAHLASLTARERATVLDQIERQLVGPRSPRGTESIWNQVSLASLPLGSFESDTSACTMPMPSKCARSP